MRPAELVATSADGRLLAEGLRALAQVPASGRPPVLLAFHPQARTNPFQAVLHRQLLPAGVAPVALHRLSDLEDLSSLRALGITVVVHLHWTNVLTKGAADEQEAEDRADLAIAQLETIPQHGHRLLWTLHNTMPHECAHPDVEVRLRRRLVELADAIHVMGPATAEEVEELYPLRPERTRLIPHPDLSLAYPRHMSREAARFERGIPLHAPVLAFAGAIRPYKGADRLVQAFDRLRTTDDRAAGAHLLLAGMPPPGDDLRTLQDDLRTHPFVHGRIGRIPEHQMTDVLVAADVVVLPYRRILNSGVAHLALGLGRPVVVPDTGEMPALVEGGVGVRFAADDDDALVKAMGDGLELAADPATPDRIAARVADHDPDVVAAAFRDLVLELVDG